MARPPAVPEQPGGYFFQRLFSHKPLDKKRPPASLLGATSYPCFFLVRFGFASGPAGVAGLRYGFGGFSIADAMFYPVRTRFRTYGVTIPASLAAYVQALDSHAAVRALIEVLFMIETCPTPSKLPPRKVARGPGHLVRDACSRKLGITRLHSRPRNENSCIRGAHIKRERGQDDRNLF